MALEETRRMVAMTQRDLDRLAGLTPGTTHDIERGRVRRPSHDTVTRIVRALRRRGLSGITAEQLFPVGEEALAS